MKPVNVNRRSAACELSVHRHHLDQPPLPDAVRGGSDAAIDMDQLHPSLSGVASSLCDRVGARTRLASPPVVFYAGLFVCVDVAYNFFEGEVLARAGPARAPGHTRRRARTRG